jgi:hypothetical protein
LGDAIDELYRTTGVQAINAAAAGHLDLDHVRIAPSAMRNTSQQQRAVIPRITIRAAAPEKARAGYPITA